MKTLPLKSQSGILASLLLAGLRSAAAEDAPVVGGIVLSNNLAVITWTGGRPTYQVQTRSTLDEAWTHIGSPTTQTSVALPVGGEQAYFRIVSDFTARYRVEFQSSWSQATHPDGWTAGAHWSGLVGATHNADVHFWREGERASEGIRLMAERGQQATLLAEVTPAIAAGTAHLKLAGGGIGTSPGSVSLVFPEPVRRDFPLVTLVSMIAPSPDWFAGVDSLSLVQDGQWAKSLTATLYGYDAGTDSGVTFTSPDLVSSPRGAVTRFSGFPALNNGAVTPFGSFVFTRLD